MYSFSVKNVRKMLLFGTYAKLPQEERGFEQDEY